MKKGPGLGRRFWAAVQWLENWKGNLLECVDAGGVSVAQALRTMRGSGQRE